MAFLNMPLSPELHMFTNQEALQTRPYLWRFHYIDMIDSIDWLTGGDWFNVQTFPFPGCQGVGIEVSNQ